MEPSQAPTVTATADKSNAQNPSTTPLQNYFEQVGTASLTAFVLGSGMGWLNHSGITDKSGGSANNNTESPQTAYSSNHKTSVEGGDATGTSYKPKKLNSIRPLTSPPPSQLVRAYIDETKNRSSYSSRVDIEKSANVIARQGITWGAAVGSFVAVSEGLHLLRNKHDEANFFAAGITASLINSLAGTNFSTIQRNPQILIRRTLFGGLLGILYHYTNEHLLQESSSDSASTNRNSANNSIFPR